MLHFRYKSTNCFLVKSAKNGRLLAVDAGWPCTLHEYARSMKSIDCHLEDVSWAIVTHCHMDHAGLITDFIQRGIRCLLFENQVGFIDAMERTILKNRKDYRKIDQVRLERIRPEDFPDVFGEEGIGGEVIVTDYHSPDSITYISDAKEAAVGDLPPVDQGMPDDTAFARNWAAIRSRGVVRVFPSHAETFDL